MWVSWLQRMMTGPGGSTPIPQTTDTPEVLAVLESGSGASSQVQDNADRAPTTIAGELQPHPMEVASQNVPANAKPINSASAFRGRKLVEGGDALRAAAAHDLGSKLQLVTLGDAVPYFVETDSEGFARFPAGGAETGRAIKDTLRSVWRNVKVLITGLFGPGAPAVVAEGQDSVLAARAGQRNAIMVESMGTFEIERTIEIEK